MNENAPKVANELKHVEIQQATKALSSVIFQLEGLLNEIRNGCGQPPEDKKKEQEITKPLAEVLSCTAIDLKDKRAQMQALIGEIHNELY